MYIADGIAYPDAEYGKRVQDYLSRGFDRKTAEYFASGRKRITSVTANDDFSLRLCFDNGEVRLLDCEPLLEVGTVFAPFRELSNFKRVYLDEFNCVSWDIDAHIGPLGSIEFAAEFCKNGANCRANVGIGLTKAPLGLKGIWHEGSEGI